MVVHGRILAPALYVGRPGPGAAGSGSAGSSCETAIRRVALDLEWM